MAVRPAASLGRRGAEVRYLLDTHVLLWARASPELLTNAARQVLRERENVLYLSVASLWECAVKCSIGKLKLPSNFYRSLFQDYEVLEIAARDLEACVRLPVLHRDTFDRLLVAQAQLSDLTLVTRDNNIAKYDVPVLLA